MPADNISSCKTYAETFYEGNGNSLKALAILCQGLTDKDGQPLVNPSALPWSAAERPSAIKLTAGDLRKEVERRTIASGNILAGPRPKAWTIPRLSKWLDDNPISDVAEVAFIKSTIAERVHVAKRAAEEAPAPRNNGGVGGGSIGNWVGKYPHLRLIHCIIDDNDIKAAYLARNNCPRDRMVVENRNSPEARAANIWVMVANKWNDAEYMPVTSLKPETHSDFAQPIYCAFEAVSHMQSATPEKVEEKWNSMNLALKRIIQNWERSGQGFGGFINEEDVCEVDEEGDSDNEDDDSSNGGKKASFGSLTERPPQSLESRRNFVDGRSTYLLYLWDMLCEHDLFQSSMQQLKEGIGSGNGNTKVPSVIHGKRKNDDDDSLGSSSKKSNNVMTQLGASITKHADSMLAVAKMAAVEQEKN